VQRYEERSPFRGFLEWWGRLEESHPLAPSIVMDGECLGRQGCGESPAVMGTPPASPYDRAGWKPAVLLLFVFQLYCFVVGLVRGVQILEFAVVEIYVVLEPPAELGELGVLCFEHCFEVYAAIKR
jgi:hypothetical protein